MNSNAFSQIQQIDSKKIVRETNFPKINLTTGIVGSRYYVGRLTEKLKKIKASNCDHLTHQVNLTSVQQSPKKSFGQSQFRSLHSNSVHHFSKKAVLINRNRKVVGNYKDSISPNFKEKIGATLNKNKKTFSLEFLNSRFKLNDSYLNCFLVQNRYASILEGIKKRQPTKSLKPRHKIVGHSQAINQYRFKVSQMQNNCYDGAFPLARHGASLVSIEDSLYLYGGYSTKGINQKVHLHRYDFGERQWTEVKLNSLKSRKNVKKGIHYPSISPCYHTSESYRGYLLFIGGMSLDTAKNKRYFNSEINAFNTETNQWIKIDWKVNIRSHASVIYGNTLVVYGGINEKNQFSSSVHIVTLNTANIQNSYHYELGLTKLKAGSGFSQFQQPIAYHQMVSTSKIQPTLLSDLPKSGVFVFGGKSPSSITDNNVRYLDLTKITQTNHEMVNSKDKMFWQIVGISGKKPEPRYLHSMTLMKKKGIVLLAGGKNGNDEVLMDSWILDLLRLTWIKVAYVQQDNILTIKQGIFNHSVACINSQFLIYGGVFGNKEISSLFLNMNCEYKRIEKKESRGKQVVRKP